MGSIKPVLFLIIAFGLYANVYAWSTGTEEIVGNNPYYYYNR